MGGAILPLLQYPFMAWCSVKAQGQIYFYLTCLHNSTFLMNVSLSIKPGNLLDKRGFENGTVIQ
jgi:hypothetical protein